MLRRRGYPLTQFPGSLADALIAYPVSSGRNEFAIKRELFPHQSAADVPAVQAGLKGATQRPVTEAALSEGLPTDAPPWKYLPSWFVIGDQDLNIPARYSVPGRVFRLPGTREIAGAPQALLLSQPDDVVATIVEAVAPSRSSPGSVEEKPCHVRTTPRPYRRRDDGCRGGCR